MAGKLSRVGNVAKWKPDKERFALTPCNDNHLKKWGGYENNRWFQPNVSISML